MSGHYLFVYGTLRSVSGIPQQDLLRTHAELLGEACINAVMYELGGYPGIRLSSNPSDIVSGELYRLKHHQHDQLLAQLDEYEECSPQFALPHEFTRERVSVTLDHNQLVLRAWAYLYNRIPRPARRIASGDYYADDHGDYCGDYSGR
ncbi:MAG: gamma-glutamylcyclotransferase family protein [Gammaproteobacteria bacterium]